MTERERRLARGALVAIWVSCLLAGAVVFVRGSEAGLQRERELFSTLMRRAQVTVHLKTMIEETRFWAQNRIMRQALIEFDDAWRELGPEAAATLNRLYVAENPYPAGERDNLERANDRSTYSDVHQLYHYWLRSFLLHRGVYDVFLVDPAGHIVYTSFKERDFATNLVDGPFADSDLGRAFREARENPFPSFVAVYDFAPFAPSGDAPALFTAAPVLADDGRLVGVIAFQMPPDRINLIVREVGARATGKTFIVGPDLSLRSRTRFSDSDTMLETRVDTETARAALAGEEGQRLALDYRGVPVLSTYSPLRVDRLHWAILAEIDRSEYLSIALDIGLFALAASAGLAALASGLLWLWLRRAAGAP